MQRQEILKSDEDCASQNMDSRLAPTASCHDAGCHDHFVQFYERDEFLVDSVSGFIAAGLRAGEAGIVIATAEHRHLLEERLAKLGVDVADLRDSGQYIALDAAETLSRFMREGMPQETLFFNVIGAVVRRAAQGARPVRAFGEMVALLWADGRASAAIRLEELWNELAKTHSFSLFCAYPMSGFRGEGNAQPFLEICKTHSKVIPAESYAAEGGLDERLRTITLLQQKAASLEAEIAERKHAESVARAEQTKLNMAVAAAQLGVWELDLVTNAFTCSEQCKLHFGVCPEEAVTYDRLFELVHPEDRFSVQNAFQRSVSDCSDYTMEFRVVDTGGVVRWISSMGRCFHNGVHRMLGVTLDVTDRMRTAQILEETVAKRTAELQATVGELEAFSYSISHDMRAPLRSMQGFAHILMEECGDKFGPENRDHLERITAAAERMDRLIQDVLTFSRVARTELILEPVNLDHLVRGILECYPNLQPPQTDIAIEGRLPFVIGNAASLTQCLSNLLGNAVKFVACGTQPRVRIRVEAVPAAATAVTRAANSAAQMPSASTVRLCIQDNGIGIPREAHEKIFAIFQRLHKQYDGTGIGLAIVKKAAERMGARVGIESEPGKGSTFWLELPRCEKPTA